MTSPADDGITEHRLGRAGCRCGWEEQAGAFRWSGELRALVFPPAVDVARDGGRDPVSAESRT